MTDPIVIGFGGNVGSDEAILQRFTRAREAIGALGDLRSAPLFRSAAVGPAQPAYLNTAVRVRMPDAQPLELISTLLELERLLGRIRPHARWGPRAIDLDVLVWGARRIALPELTVPHPGLGTRRFALDPLVALVGEAFEVPGLGTAGTLLAAVRDQVVEHVADTW